MRALLLSQCSLLTCCQLLMYVMYMGMLKIHSQICGNRWFVQIQHYTSHICPICAVVWNVSEHREMRIGAILGDCQRKDREMERFICLDKPPCYWIALMLHLLLVLPLSLLLLLSLQLLKYVGNKKTRPVKWKITIMHQYSCNASAQ